MNRIQYITGLLLVLFAMPFVTEAQTAKWLIKPKYNAITDFGNGMYKVKAGRYYGIIDSEGKTIVATSADSITTMTEEHALILQYDDEKYRLTGILNEDKTVLPINENWFVHDYPFFSEGKLPVYNEKGLYGFIDPDGHVVIKFEYGTVRPFSEGWASVSKGKSLIGKGVSFLKKTVNKNSKDKVFYIDDQERVMNLHADIGDIYTGTSFKNGEALVIRSDNKHCIINTSGLLVRIDNNVAMVFDEKYALKSPDDEVPDKKTISMSFDGPSTFAQNDLYGYKVGNKIILPAQFKEAEPFSKGLALVAVGKNWGVLQLVNDNFDCAPVESSIASSENDSESIDYEVSVPTVWRDEELVLTCTNPDGTEINCQRPGDANAKRTFSFILKKGERQLSLRGNDLTVWDSSMKTVVDKKQQGQYVSISIAQNSSKANAKDNAPVSVEVKNTGKETLDFTVTITGDGLKSITKNLSLKGNQSEKISTFFLSVTQEGSRMINVATSLTENTVSKRIKVIPFFVSY